MASVRFDRTPERGLDAGRETSRAGEPPPASERVVESAEPAPKPIDPGAARLIHSISEAIRLHAAGDAGEVRIALGQMRNQSRADVDEFAAAMRRFTALLARAAEELSVVEVVPLDPRAAYELRATVYLLRVAGADVWEIFPTIHPRDGAWTVWQSDGPVRLPREEAAGDGGLIYPLTRGR